MEQMKLVSETLEDLGFTTFVQVLTVEGLVSQINNASFCTLWVPTNEAFESSNGKLTKDLVLNHIVTKKLFARDLKDGQILQSQAKRDLFINK